MKFICALLVVEDIKKSREFYENVLHQRVKDDFNENVTFDGDFAIHKADHFKKLISEEDDVLVLPQSNNAELYFEDDQLEKVERRLIKNNVQFIHKIKTQPWQQRVIRFYDPDFHIIEVGESMENVCIRLSNDGYDSGKIAKLTSIPQSYVENIIG